jgi:hypothetical protein
MFLAKIKFASALFVTMTFLGVSPLLFDDLALAQEKQPAKQAEGPLSGQVSAEDTKHDLAWVEKRIQAWQPTKEERRFDQIGWAKDLPEALRLGKEKGRPIFVFTHKGHMQFGRC